MISHITKSLFGKPLFGAFQRGFSPGWPGRSSQVDEWGWVKVAALGNLGLAPRLKVRPKVLGWIP